MNTASAALRRLIYPLLMTVAVAAIGGRILSANLVYEPYLSRNAWEPADGRRVWPSQVPTPMPTFSSNDRSRWATVRALVEEGTYVVGRRDPSLAGPKNKYGDTGIIFEDGWQSIDKVMRPETGEFYSSKPPLFTTVVAGEYWLLYNLLGWSIVENPWLVVRTILLTVNALPFLIYLLLLSRLLERYGQTDWGRLYTFAAACFGTFLTTFAISLNNHTVAACTALFALYPALRIWEGASFSRSPGASTESALAPGERLNDGWRFAVCGFFAALTACVELPAAAFAVFLTLLLLVRFPRQTLLWLVPAAAIPVAGFFVTNYLAIGRLTPAYGEFGKGQWYEYEGSPWRMEPGEHKRGIDWAFLKEDRLTYIFHFLLGHHGVFSLSPIWFLAAAGMGWGIVRLRRGSSDPPTPFDGQPGLTLNAGLALVLSVVVIGFYLFMIPRWNYAGWTSGPRWTFWLTPFWLLALLPVADWLAGRRWGRGLGYALLAVSVLSVSYPAWNPWRHPWIYNWMNAQGWIPY
jgi:hypothetical protein